MSRLQLLYVEGNLTINDLEAINKGLERHATSMPKSSMIKQ